MYFEVLGEITRPETIATGSGIHFAELHWYEAIGIGKREFKSSAFFSRD